MPQKNSTTLATSNGKYPALLVQIQARCDEAPYLIQDVRQRDQEGRHHRDFERHKERRGDIGRDHLSALGQFGQQRLRQYGVQI